MTMTRPQWLEIDAFVEAYETARVRDAAAPLANYLPPSDHPHYLAILVELVRVDLELAWQRGDKPGLDPYRLLVPAVFADPAALGQVAFEHYRLAADHGLNPDRGDYERYYGIDASHWPAATSGPPADPSAAMPRTRVLPEEASQVHAASILYERLRKEAESGGASADVWAAQPIQQDVADLFRDLHHRDPQAADRLAQATRTMPGRGDAFLGFLLVRELGRGAFGRVFLARQPWLADRLVVLKLSSDLRGESRTLAQLQHTNIVPLYSVHHSRPFQAVCMPYHGATTLADVLKDVRGLHGLPASGKQLISTIHNRHATTADPPAEADHVLTADPPAVSDALARLEKANYIDAVLWIGARLADGLAHAHARGICHRDLKPANVLLADDGTPMLLDFNLAEDAKLPPSAAEARVGGTLPYMAPEQLARYQGERGPLDGRADVYSLGILLFELLTGRHPFATPAGRATDVLPAMLAARRLPPPRLGPLNPAVSPAAEAIVRHCLESDPERRYPTATALREDLDRHLSDQPLKHVAEPSAVERFQKWRRRHPRLTSLTTVAALAVVLVATAGAVAVLRWRQAERLQAREQARAFRDAATRAEVLVCVRKEDRDPLQAYRRQAVDLLDRYHVRSDPDWQRRSAVTALDEPDRAAVREAVGTLAFFLARGDAMRLERTRDEAEREQLADAIREWKALAAECLADSPHRGCLARLEADPAPGAPASGREAFLVASDLFAGMKYGEALPWAMRAAEETPDHYPAQFLLANCHLFLGNDARAEPVYGTCVALWPEFHWAYYNRALTRLRLGQPRGALEDFDRVVRLAPELVEARVERGKCRQQLQDYRGAVAEFTHALTHGAGPTVHFLRSRAHALAGNAGEAKKDLDAGLSTTPINEEGWVARGLARLPKDPAAAVADFDEALKRNPRSRPARQNKAHVLSEHLKKGPESICVLDELLTDYPDYLPALAGRAVLLARQGDRTRAHADAVRCLKLSQQAETAYQVAGVYALTSRTVPEDKAEAFRLLALALADRGYGLDLLADDPDLDPIRKADEFRQLTEAARLLRLRSKR